MKIPIYFKFAFVVKRSTFFLAESESFRAAKNGEAGGLADRMKGQKNTFFSDFGIRNFGRHSQILRSKNVFFWVFRTDTFLVVLIIFCRRFQQQNAHCIFCCMFRSHIQGKNNKIWMPKFFFGSESGGGDDMGN